MAGADFETHVPPALEDHSAEEGVGRGYTGRKLVRYIWIPKPKVDLYEYRQLLKLCEEVEARDGAFNDRTAGKLMVDKRAIFDGHLDAEAYKEKYDAKNASMQSYVSNARMTMRICRWLGWMTRVAGQEAAYRLTDYGRQIIQYDGPWPARRSGESEADSMLRDFAEMKYYSVNDVPRYQNPLFRQRVFLNMLRILARHGACSHYELALTALCIQDERDPDEWETCDELITDLKGGRLTLGQAFMRRDLSADDQSTVTGIFDGPKVLLGFARQFGLVTESTPDVLGLREQYAAMCHDSGHIKRIGVVHTLTEKGVELVERESERQCVWYDELSAGTNSRGQRARAAMLLALLQAHGTPLDSAEVSTVLNLDDDEVEALRSIGAHIIVRAGQVRLATPMVFDVYRDVPPEERDAVLAITSTLVSAAESTAAPSNDEYFVRLDIDKALLEPHYIPSAGSSSAFQHVLLNVADSATQFPLACIHCAQPPCMTYRERTGMSRAQDYLSHRVCPVDLIRITEDGHITIDADTCTGCMLCISRCPISAIGYENGKAQKAEYDSIADGVVIAPMFLELAEKRERTDQQLQRLRHRHDMGSSHDIKDILDNFERQINGPGSQWAQVQFYTWVRNVYRSFGLDARYTGAPGMKTRSDVTIYSPIRVTNEVKSPAESSVAAKAVRQAVDAQVQLEFPYTAAIGATISNDAPEHARRYLTSLHVRVPLLTSRVLLYLFMKNVPLPQSADDLIYIFQQSGVIDKQVLHAYFDRYFDRRDSGLRELNATDSIPEALADLPMGLHEAVVHDAETDGLVVTDPTQALEILGRLRDATHAEIDRCFS